MKMSNENTPVLSFVAKSGSGKTTLLEKVITRLKQDNYRIAVIKHDAHQFDIDKPGKDTWRMAQAGADIVAISSPAKVAVIEKVIEEKKLDDVINMISDVDLILTEGFKLSGKPAIEVFRSDVHKTLLCEPDRLIALASDIPWDIGVPCYNIDDIEGVAGEVIKYIKNFKKA
jgi:molybdopterin-guanine dinucleotide biosynthesis protein B